MASGKKGRKKGTTMDLFAFVGQNVGVATDKAIVMAPKVSSWADDVDDEPEYTKNERIILPTAPKAARGGDLDESMIPKNGPYCARVANLPYEVEESDLETFFKGLKIKTIRMPRDGNRIKGYAFVEFEEKLDLIEAISRNDLLILNRKIKVELNMNEDRNRNRGGPRDFESQEDRTVGDWRSAREPLAPAPPGRDSGGYGRDRERGFSNYGKSDGFDRDRQDDRRGGFDRDRGEGDRFGGRRGYGGGYERREERETEAPKERARLQLAPRTKPVEAEDPAPAATKASIFGSAKPVDTLRKELEIEQKLKSTTITPPAPEEKPKPKVDIFGGARPVDTLTREREIEEKLKKDRVVAPSDRPSRSNGYEGPSRNRLEPNRSTSRDEPNRTREGYRSNSRDEVRSRKTSENDRHDHRQTSRDHSPVRTSPDSLPPPKVSAWTRKPAISEESREDRPPSSTSDRDRRTPEPRGKTDRDYVPPSRGFGDRDDYRGNYNSRDTQPERRDYRNGRRGYDDRRGFADRRGDDRRDVDRRPYNDDRRGDDRRPYDSRRPYNDDKYGRRQPEAGRYEEPRRDRDPERYGGDRRDAGRTVDRSSSREPPRGQGDRERDRKPIDVVPKKYEEPAKPVFAQSSKFSLLKTEDEELPSGEEE